MLYDEDVCRGSRGRDISARTWSCARARSFLYPSGDPMKSNPLAVAAGLMLLAGSAATNTANSQASTRVYREGPIAVMTYVKTKPGMFDRYMEYLNGPYKAQNEAEKSAGIIQDY